MKGLAKGGASRAHGAAGAEAFSSSCQPGHTELLKAKRTRLLGILGSTQASEMPLKAVA